MIDKFLSGILYMVILLTILPSSISIGQQDIVEGNLIQFNDNGLWCWFQDERAIVDKDNGKIILGFDESQAGLGGSPRNGIVRSVIYDLLTGILERFQLRKSGCDDHNAPGFIIRPDGKYLSMYSDHYDNFNRYRIFDGSGWTSEQVYDWSTRPGGTDYTIAYNNLYYLSAEGRMYDFSRANHRTPNFLISDDLGNSWTWGGQLTTNSSNSYNKGYYKYWSNGVDRIDFVLTEQHPRDTLTSIYHGYIKGGKAYKSNGTLVDSDIWDTTYIPAYWNFTKVFSNGTVIGDKTMYRCWQSDIVRYDDGTIATIISARSNQYISYGYPDYQINPPHDFIYCRYDGSNWSYTYLDKAGYKFYSSEADYIGLAALCPNDPNTLYISTPYDPRDTTIDLGVREIFKGVTSNNGATWNWTPITQNSTRDNVRPIVPAWDENNTVLLWCRGTYISAQSFDAAIVGIIDEASVVQNLMNYVDANLSNTTLFNNNLLVTTGPNGNAGADDNQWHERTGYGNGGSVFTSSESGNGENAPELKTQITVNQNGTYDIWVNFWANPDADWRIAAGLSVDNLQIFRSMASKQVDANAHSTSIVLSGSGNTYLYQAYVGRLNMTAGGIFDVYVDDYAIRTGTSNTSVGDVARTWYDGISYSKTSEIVPVELLSFTAVQNRSSINVQWKTSSELNNHGFEIEKQSKNVGKYGDWILIAFVDGQGTTTKTTEYLFKDDNIDFSVSSLRYRLKQIDYDGTFKYSNIAEVNSITPIAFNVSQNYPNPFNPVTKITYALPDNVKVSLKIYNSLGEEIETLVNEEMPAGNYSVRWNALAFPSGVYFYHLTAGTYSETKKMILLK